MTSAAGIVLRVPVVVVLAWVFLSLVVPIAMTRYLPDMSREGVRCERTDVAMNLGGPYPPGVCRPLTELYGLPLPELMLDSALRSAALLAGAAVLALVVGGLLGSALALARYRAFTSGSIITATALVASVPAFFVAYFLQIAVILLGPAGGRGQILPVYGFGYDEHLVLPLLSVSLTAIAFTAQLTAVRLRDVLTADFVTVARAKGLSTSWILAIHSLPHVRPVLLEALGSGLRVSAASLPIIELLFVWRGIGQLALEAALVHDATVLVLSGVGLAAVFAILSAVADLSRPGTLGQSRSI